MCVVVLGDVMLGDVGQCVVVLGDVDQCVSLC